MHLLNNGGEQNLEYYKKINPMGEVPTLVHDGKKIGQSLVILQYLDEVFPQNPLFPKDTFSKMQVFQFCENINTFMHSLGNLKVLQYLEKKHGYTQEQKEEWFGYWNHRGYSVLEKILQDTSGKFCFGDQVTAADMFLIPHTFTALRNNFQISKYPICHKIYENCKSVPAFEKAHPLNQPDTPKS